MVERVVARVAVAVVHQPLRDNLRTEDLTARTHQHQAEQVRARHRRARQVLHG